MLEPLRILGLPRGRSWSHSVGLPTAPWTPVPQRPRLHRQPQLWRAGPSILLFLMGLSILLFLMGPSILLFLEGPSILLFLMGPSIHLKGLSILLVGPSILLFLVGLSQGEHLWPPAQASPHPARVPSIVPSRTSPGGPGQLTAGPALGQGQGQASAALSSAGREQAAPRGSPAAGWARVPGSARRKKSVKG